MGIMWAVIAGLAVLTAGVAALGYYFSEQVLRIRVHQSEAILDYELNEGRFTREQFDGLPKEEAWIDSPFGYRLHAWVAPPSDGTPLESASRIVVFVHGVTSSLIGMVKYVDMFRRRGFHVVLYDHRRHGLSGGGDTSYGYYEKIDLKRVVDWVFERFGPEAQVGVFGESMGAATVLQYAANDDRPSFMVADCPYSDLGDQLAYRLKVQYRLPRFPLLLAASVWSKLRSGFYFHEVSPIRVVDSIRVPVLFAHGREDRFVPTWMSEVLYEKKQGAKALYVAPGAAHAEAWPNNREAYEAAVDAFLREHGLLGEAAVE